MEGIIIGAIAFILIGLFHPLVIWAEYYFTSRCWPVFLIVGILFLVGSVAVENLIGSAALGIAGMSSFWSILELRKQKERVEKGWFPDGRKRKEKKEGPR